MKINKIFESILLWPRPAKLATQLIVDLVIVSLAYWVVLSLWSRVSVSPERVSNWLVVASAYLIAMWCLGVYSSIVRFVRPSILLRLGLSAFIAVSGLYFFNEFVFQEERANRFYADLLVLAALGSLLPRLGFAQLARWRDAGSAKRVAIYGAGRAGRQLHSFFETGVEYKVVAYIDDDTAVQNKRISGVEVFTPSELDCIAKLRVDEVHLALPTISQYRRREIILDLERLDVGIMSVPDLRDIVSGRAKIAELQQVAPEEILSRRPVPPVSMLMSGCIAGRVVLVTGAGGTIGSQLAREALAQHPSKLLLLDNSEFALYSIEAELSAKPQSTTEIVPILGSVSEPAQMARLFKTHRVDTVYHAAAYKHVPMVEVNPIQGVANNVFGTLIVAEAALEAEVRHFVLVSTDKAVRPTNVMGASKRIAELCIQALAERHQDECAFTIVRFGNVYGSSGSVIPKFRKQITAGGPVTVTHPAMTRYFMMVEEAAQLVIQAGAMGTTGEVYVLDMGEPVNIFELAKRKIRFMGLKPRLTPDDDGDIEIQFTGLRPGEKMYEELLIRGAKPTEHPRIFHATEPHIELDSLHVLLQRLKQKVMQADEDGVRQVLAEIDVVHYQPKSESDTSEEQPPKTA